MADAPDPLRRLDRWRVHATEETIRRDGPDGQPDELIAGQIGALKFVVSRDGDGLVNASVSLTGGERALERHVFALCRHMGVAPPEHAQRIRGGGLFWTVKEGKLHA